MASLNSSSFRAAATLGEVWSAASQFSSPAAAAPKSIIRRRNTESRQPSAWMRALILSMPSRSIKRLVAILSLSVIISSTSSITVRAVPAGRSCSTPAPATRSSSAKESISIAPNSPALICPKASTMMKILIRLADRIGMEPWAHFCPLARSITLRAKTPASLTRIWRTFCDIASRRLADILSISHHP